MVKAIGCWFKDFNNETKLYWVISDGPCSVTVRDDRLRAKYRNATDEYVLSCVTQKHIEWYFKSVFGE